MKYYNKFIVLLKLKKSYENNSGGITHYLIHRITLCKESNFEDIFKSYHNIYDLLHVLKF